jgi:hypothetical protein
MHGKQSPPSGGLPTADSRDGLVEALEKPPEGGSVESNQTTIPGLNAWATKNHSSQGATGMPLIDELTLSQIQSRATIRSAQSLNSSRS